MKKILLLTIIPLVMLVADFTLIGGQLTPSSDPVASPTGSAKTNWGFQPFSIPSDSVTVPAGGNIQTAIDSLPNGGTVNLEEGLYYGDHIRPKSNIVLQGAGIAKTTIKFNGAATHALISAHGGSKTNGLTNIILRNFKADCAGTDNANGIEFIYGVSNVLVENIDIFGANKTNLTVNNGSWDIGGKHYTFRNINTYATSLYHGLSVKYIRGVIVDNIQAHDLAGYGLDFSRVVYGEIANSSANNCGTGATKFPSSNYIYIHDTIFKDNSVLGIKFEEGSAPNGSQYIHLDNVTVDNSGDGIRWIGLETVLNPPVKEMIVRGVKLINNRSNWDNGPVEPYGEIRTQVRLNIIMENLHEYGDNVGITFTHPINYYTHPTSTPEEDNVGWSSWPVLQ